MAVVIGQFQYNTEKGKEIMQEPMFHNPKRETVTQQNKPLELVQRDLIELGDITKDTYKVSAYKHHVRWQGYCYSKQEICSS